MPHSRDFLIKMIFWWLWDKAMNFCHLDKKIPVRAITVPVFLCSIFTILKILRQTSSADPVL